MTSAIVGIGNRLRGDDAAGLLVIDELRREGLPDVELVTSDGDPAELLEILGEFDRVTLVDALVSGRPPGTVTRIDPRSWDDDALLRSSSHLVGLREALDLGSVLGALPSQLVLIGVEASAFLPMTDPRDEVLTGVAEAARVIADLEATHA